MGARKTVQKKRGAQQRGAKRRAVRRQPRNWLPAIRFAVFCAAVSVAVLLGFKVVSSVGDVSVERVSFAGDLQYVSRDRLIERVNPHLDTGYFGLRLDEIKHSVEQEPWVFAAQVERVWPWSLKVTIEEQTPIAYWGREALLNYRGEVFTPQAMPSALELPVLSGPSVASANVMQAYQLINQMLAETPLKLAQLKLDQHGQWLGVTRGDVEIRLGRKQPVQNMKRFLLVYRERLQARFAEVQQVDTRYINGIAVDWRSASS